MDWMGMLDKYVLAHWAFFAMAGILMVAGEVAKRSVWRKQWATKSKLIWIGRKTMPMHPILVGSIAGAVGFPVSEGVEGMWSAVLYHGAAGMFSGFLFQQVKALGKKYGIEVEIAGGSDFPYPTEEQIKQAVQVLRSIPPAAPESMRKISQSMPPPESMRPLK